MTKRKLTEPQRLLLGELIRRGPQIVSETYAPAKGLVTKGCATWLPKVGLDDPRLAVTIAGRTIYDEETR